MFSTMKKGGQGDIPLGHAALSFKKHIETSMKSTHSSTAHRPSDNKNDDSDNNNNTNNNEHKNENSNCTIDKNGNVFYMHKAVCMHGDVRPLNHVYSEPLGPTSAT